MEYGSLEFVQYIANQTHKEAMRQNISYQEMHRLMFLNVNEDEMMMMSDMEDVDNEQVRIFEFPRFTTPSKGNKGNTSSQKSSQTSSTAVASAAAAASSKASFQKTIPIKFENPPPVTKKPIQQKKVTAAAAPAAATLTLATSTAAAAHHHRRQPRSLNAV